MDYAFGVKITIKKALEIAIVSSLPLFNGAAIAGCPPEGFTVAPTDTDKTFIREGNGQYGAARSGGFHGGSDIIVRASYPDKLSYSVFCCLRHSGVQYNKLLLFI